MIDSPPARSRLGIVSLVLILSAFGLVVLSFVVGLALAASVAGQGDVTLAWAPLILPVISAFIAIPLAIAAVIVAIVALRRRPRGLAIATLIIAAVTLVPGLYLTWAATIAG